MTVLLEVYEESAAKQYHNWKYSSCITINKYRDDK